MAITFVAAQTADFTASNSATVTAPAGVAEHDLLLVHILAPWPTALSPLDADRQFLTAPTNDWWIVGIAMADTVRPALSVVLAKLATAAEPASYTFTIASDIPANTATGSIGISAWHGVDYTAPIIAAGATAFHSAGATPTITDSAIGLPVTNALAVLISGCHWTLTGGHVIGAITEPASSTNRYTRNQSASNWGTIDLASRAITTGSTAAYAWTATTNPDSSLELYAHTVILRDTANAQGGTWARILANEQYAVNEAPSLFFQADAPASIYSVNLGFDTGSGNDTFTVDKITTATQAVADTFVLQEGVQYYSAVENAGAINVIGCDCPDHNLYWSTYGTPDDANVSYLFRYDTATLSDQQQSADFGDACRAIRVGRKGTWSENTVFVTHYGTGPTSASQVMVHYCDKTTLAITRTLTLGSFFSGGELAAAPNIDFHSMDTDSSGDVWLGVRYFVYGVSNKWYLFHLGSTGTVTRYDLSATMNPTVQLTSSATRIAVGFDRKSGYLLVSDQHYYNHNADAPYTTVVLLFDPVGHTVIGSYTPTYAGLSGPVESYPGFISDSANSSASGVWIPYGGVIDSTVSGGRERNPEYSYLIKLALPGLTESQVITLPPGYARIIDAVLDLSVSPNRLWCWLSRYPYNSAFPWGFAGVTYTNQQGSADTLIGSELWTLTLSTETATYSGTPCGATPVITCYTLGTLGGRDIATLTGTGLAGTTTVYVSPSNNINDGNKYQATILSKNDTTVVVALPNSTLGQGYWFLLLGDGTQSLGTNTPCTPPAYLAALSPWPTIRVWFEQLEP
jgi:hypothetical protein